MSGAGTNAQVMRPVLGSRRWVSKSGRLERHDRLLATGPHPEGARGGTARTLGPSGASGGTARTLGPSVVTGDLSRLELHPAHGVRGLEPVGADGQREVRGQADLPVRGHPRRPGHRHILVGLRGRTSHRLRLGVGRSSPSTGLGGAASATGPRPQMWPRPVGQ